MVADKIIKVGIADIEIQNEDLRIPLSVYAFRLTQLETRPLHQGDPYFHLIPQYIDPLTSN